jgi:hypothetical protein
VAGTLVGGGATVVGVPQDAKIMLANTTRLNTMLIFLLILISPPKKDLGTTGNLCEGIPTVIEQTLLPKESHLQMERCSDLPNNELFADKGFPLRA